VATSNSVFVRKSDLNSFKEEPALTLSAQEGSPFSLRCQPPDGWPKPSVYWMMQNSGGSLKSINSSRMTVDPEGTLWFSNVTRADTSDDFVYACSATSLFRSSSNAVTYQHFDTISRTLKIGVRLLTLSKYRLVDRFQPINRCFSTFFY